MFCTEQRLSDGWKLYNLTDIYKLSPGRVVDLIDNNVYYRVWSVAGFLSTYFEPLSENISR